MKSYSMNSKPNSQLPIGYWLKHADEVITGHVNEVLSQKGLTRFHWQVLNTVRENGSMSLEQLFQPMQTFVTADGLDEIINEFVKRGWLVSRRNGESDAIKLELTNEGQEGYQLVLSLQSEVRKRAMQGVSEEEYTTVIRVLQKVVANLEK